MRVLSSSSKPISSPGRTDKFPPPLMRFLRSNVGSRSRGRTKANPLFMRRRKAVSSSASSTLETTTQEPSSPKVTCIGQVRVRRSRSSSKSRKKYSNKTSTTNSNCCCCYCGCGWYQKPKCCKLKFWCNKLNFSKWFSFFNCRSVKVRTDSSKFGSNRFEPPHEEVQEAEDEVERRESISIDTTQLQVATTATTTPPKNALMLTRCRSAPYRSSSLACRFWGSPETEEFEEEKERMIENTALGIEHNNNNNNNNNKVSSRSSSSCASRRDSTSESRADHEDITETCNGGNSSSSNRVSFKKEALHIGVCAHSKNENNNSSTKTSTSSIDIIINVNNNGGPNSNEVEMKKINGGVVDDGEFPKPLRLMRCKSEPARRRDSEKFNPESSEFWRHTRFPNTHSSIPLSHSNSHSRAL